MLDLSKGSMQLICCNLKPLWLELLWTFDHVKDSYWFGADALWFLSPCYVLILCSQLGVFKFLIFFFNLLAFPLTIILHMVWCHSRSLNYILTCEFQIHYEEFRFEAMDSGICSWKWRRGSVGDLKRMHCCVHMWNSMDQGSGTLYHSAWAHP